MNPRNLVILVVAIVLGLVAVYLGNAYFSGVQTRQARIAEQQKLARIVVARQPLEFGKPVTEQSVRLVNWPQNSVPQGAFTSIEDATKNRVALRPIVVGEPILASKVSGANGRATLSANLPDGMLAYTIPISATAGVGGFVRPGDVVDVLLTRSVGKDGEQVTDVMLQAVPVLGIDQVQSDKDTKAKVGKTATLQVDTIDAQKLALATHVGNLSLALRNVADQATGFHRSVIPRDLTQSPRFIASRGPVNRARARAVPARGRSGGMRSGVVPAPRRNGPTMTVVRGVQPTEYEVQGGF